MDEAFHPRIDQLVDDALAAFWDAVASKCPAAKTGDLSPLTTAALDRAATTAVAEWGANNCL